MAQTHEIDRALRQAWLADLKPILWIIVVLAVFFAFLIAWAITPTVRSHTETGVVESLFRRQTDLGRVSDYASVRLESGKLISLPIHHGTPKKGDEMQVCFNSKQFIWKAVTHRQCSPVGDN